MIEILSYFNLNKRAARGERSMRVVIRPEAKVEDKAYKSPLTGPERMRKALRVERTAAPPPQLQAATQMSLWEQLMMYFGTVIGVLFSSAVMQFKSGEVDSFSLTMTMVLLSVIVAFVIVPVVFEKLTVKTDAPFLVRFGLFVQQGVFWPVLFSSIP